MITIILIIHLSLAVAYMLSIAGLTIAAAFKKAVPAIKTSVITSFGTTIGTGILLVIVSPKAMAQFCTSTVISSAFGIVAWKLYERRLAAMQPKKSTIY